MTIAAAAPVLAEDPPQPPPRQFAEELTFDPKAGQWRQTTQPVAGTEDGDLNIARQWLARRDYGKALDALKYWIKTYGPQSPRYPEALYLQGTAYLEKGDYRSAHETYQQLLGNYPGSHLAPDALEGDFRVAEQYLAGRKRKAFFGLLRVRDREAGVQIMGDIMANYSDTPLAEKAQLSRANYYFSRGEMDAAEDEYAAFARTYPRSRWASYALLQSARAALAAFPGIEFDDTSLVEAEERYRQFLQLYPDVARQVDVPVILEQIAAKRADKTLSIARFYEKTRKGGAALYYYRAVVSRWPGTPAAEEARGRLAALGEQITAPPPAVSANPPAAPRKDG